MFNKVFIPLITVLTPILVAGLTLFVQDTREQINTEIKNSQSTLELKIADVDRQLRELEAHRLERESIQEYNITVLKEVKESLARDDPVVQKVVIGLLQSMPNQDLAQTWLKALEASENTSADNKEAARDIRQAIQYDQEQSQIAYTPIAIKEASKPKTADALRPPGQPFDWEDYDYDIFYCEDAPTHARDDAERIVAKMREQKAEGRLRVRMLPIKVNQRVGYGYKGYEIRQNTNEVRQADALKNLGDGLIGDRGAFKIGTTTQATPYYLSAFLCPN